MKLKVEGVTRARRPSTIEKRRARSDTPYLLSAVQTHFCFLLFLRFGTAWDGLGTPLGRREKGRIVNDCKAWDGGTAWRGGCMGITQFFSYS